MARMDVTPILNLHYIQKKSNGNSFPDIMVDCNYDYYSRFLLDFTGVRVEAVSSIVLGNNNAIDWIKPLNFYSWIQLP